MKKRVLCVGFGMMILPAFAGQDPTLNLQFAIPVAEETVAASTTAELVGSIDKQTQRVSLRFTNAKAKDVIGWLQKQNVNFVIEDSELPKDKTVSLNLQNQPIDDVMEALGAAFDGSFEKRKDIWVFRAGRRAMFFSDDLALPGAPMAPRSLRMTLPSPPKLRGIEGKDLTPEQKKKLEAEMQHLEAEMKKLGTELGKQFQFQFKDFDGKFDEEFAKKLELQLKDFDKTFGKDFEIKMDRIGKALEVELKAHEEAMIALDKAAKAGERAVQVRVKAAQTEELFKSITPEQKKLQKDRGYLKLSDMTAEQRKLITADPKAEFEIKIVKNDETLVIKNEPEN